MDPEQIAIMEALRRLGAPHQRSIQGNPYPSDYSDEETGTGDYAFMRDTPQQNAAYAEQPNPRVPYQRQLKIAPRSEPYMDALSEADPRDMSANEQFVMRNAPVIPEYTGHDEMDPNEMEPDNDADDYYGGPNPGAQMNPAMLALSRLRGGR